MPKTTTKAKSTSESAPKAQKPKTSVAINSYVQTEISRLAGIHGLTTSVLEEFANFVIENHKKKDPVVKPVKAKTLTLAQIKTAIYEYFAVKNTTELKKSGGFKMSTDGMDNLNLSLKDGWEQLYRKFIGILPGEENQKGYGCINGINRAC